MSHSKELIQWQLVKPRWRPRTRQSRPRVSSSFVSTSGVRFRRGSCRWAAKRCGVLSIDLKTLCNDRVSTSVMSSGVRLQQW
ncbi:hypothetical protein BDN71DRAFT_1448709 [Pleurotus eryngii]|uniref:Uncharacterized protein n=1 Tax=Pleurotus eryngii TaxID=5323 RepID=A0A9P6D7Z1_PLEER|nr:hypothetical protein BDN71DRAFT_1448709 [Pleurotus eryngii]